VREIISIRLACAGAQEKALRKVTISVGLYFTYATPSGRIPAKLGIHACLADVIKLAKFHRYNWRDFGAVRC